MKNNKSKKLNIKKRRNRDVDLYDFFKNNYENLSQLEIARGEGLDLYYVKEILEEIQKDY